MGSFDVFRVAKDGVKWNEMPFGSSSSITSTFLVWLLSRDRVSPSAFFTVLACCTSLFSFCSFCCVALIWLAELIFVSPLSLMAFAVDKIAQ